MKMTDFCSFFKNKKRWHGSIFVLTFAKLLGESLLLPVFLTNN